MGAGVLLAHCPRLGIYSAGSSQILCMYLARLAARGRSASVVVGQWTRVSPQ